MSDAAHQETACFVQHKMLVTCNLRLLRFLQHDGAYLSDVFLYRVRLSMVVSKLPLILLCHHAFLFDLAEQSFGVPSFLL